MPIRILRVIPRYAPAWHYGGSVRFSYDLDVALTARGCQMTVYTSDQLDTHRRLPDRREQVTGIDVHRFPNPWNALASRAPWLGLYLMGLERALYENAGCFDLMHVTESRGAHARWAFAAARATGVPIVWSPLGTLADGLGVRRPYRRAYVVVHTTRRLVREARVLVAQSNHEASVFARHGARSSQVRVIGLGVDARWFRPLPARGHLRHSLGIDPEHPMILFIGRLHPNKGLDILLEAAAIARRTHPNLQVVLIGWDHGALRTVRRLCRSLSLVDAVRILPPEFEIARVQAYVDADVFAVAATHYEETSLAAMEALAAGTPCVLTRQCEVPGLHAVGGGRVTDCTPESFAAGLVAVLSDPRRKVRALDARQWILGSCTAEDAADQYADLFRRVVAEGEPRKAGATAIFRAIGAAR